MGLTEMLEIRPGVTAVIGGGGKTTLLRMLGEELAAAHTVLLCTTTKIFPFDSVPWADNMEDLTALQAEHRLLCAGTLIESTGKLTVPAIPMTELKKRFSYILVEADGSAGRPLKAHADHEPVIPPEANQTICVVGASGFGRRIADAAHRPERYAELAKVDVETKATPQTEAAVLLAEKLHDRVFVNQAETPEMLAQAEKLGRVLSCPVCAGSLRKGEYICLY